MVKVCRVCGIEQEDQSTDAAKCSRGRWQNACCNCRQREGKSNFACSQCKQRTSVFDTDVATAVMMASHTRLGSESAFGQMLVSLEPVIIRIIVQQGAMRGVTAARQGRRSSEAEVCVSYLQLGRCNRDDCEFSHAQTMH